MNGVTVDFEIRPATPEDQTAAVSLIHSAGPAAFDYIFAAPERPATAFLAFAFSSGRGLFGCRNHFVATQAGRVVATLALYGAAEHKPLTRILPLQIAQFHGVMRAAGILRRSLEVANLMPPPLESVEYLANFGVAPDLRGQGIGQRLLEFAAQHARGRGKFVLALDVATSNPRAQALYERVGMCVVHERQFRGPAGRVPDARRMEMTLT